MTTRTYRGSLEMAVLVVALALAGCGAGALEKLAKDTCAELEGAIVLQVGPILSKAISRAGDLGASGSELGDAMRKTCPSTMAAIDELSKEREQRDELPTQMAIVITGCSDDGASGTVKNNSGVTVDVFIDVQYLDDAGVVVDDGIGSVNGLRAGETGRWESNRYDKADIVRCRADVGSAYAK